jgi:hypothetical protein
MENMISEAFNGIDKTKRYGWVTKDEPGALKMLHKDALQIHPAYQRDAILFKVKEITANWSWVGCGAIVVGERGGEFWVIDGQHRVLAAKRRSDITTLPCVVFQTEGVRQEAVAFLDLNTGRKPVSSLGKFKAMIAAGDEKACIVHKTLESLGITAKASAGRQGELKSVAWAVKRAGENPEKFELVMRTAAELSHDMPIAEKLLDGLWYINDRLPGGIGEKRFADRVRSIGARKLIDAANKASAYFVRGGAGIWATGMMDEINKGLRNKFSLTEPE